MNASKNTYTVTAHFPAPENRLSNEVTQWQTEGTKTQALYVAAMMLNKEDCIKVTIEKKEK